MRQYYFSRFQTVGFLLATAIVFSHQACGPIGQPIATNSLESSSTAPNLPPPPPIVVDTDLPIVFLNLAAPGTPAAITTSTDALFSFTASDASSAVQSVECKLDSQNYAPCSSPNSQSFTGLATGPHTFNVRATDAAGNTSSPLQFSWTINAPPAPAMITVSLNTKPQALTNTAAAAFQFSATSNNGTISFTFSCSLDGGAAVTCGTNVAQSTFSQNVSDGPHTLQVIARDAASNASQPAQHVWTVDSKKPAVTFTSPPVSSTSTSASMTFTVTDPAPSSGMNTVECSLNGAAYSACTSPVPLSNLSVRTHTFNVRARDKATNETIITHTWDVQSPPPPTDTQAPTVAISSPTNNSTYTAAQTLKITASATDNVGVTKVDFYKDNALVGTDTAPPYEYNYSISSSQNGTHTFYAKAFDAAGNTASSTNLNMTVNIATTPPPSGLTLILNDSFEYADIKTAISSGAWDDFRDDSGGYASGPSIGTGVVHSGSKSLQVFYTGAGNRRDIHKFIPGPNGSANPFGSYKGAKRVQIEWYEYRPSDFDYTGEKLIHVYGREANGNPNVWYINGWWADSPGFPYGQPGVTDSPANSKIQLFGNSALGSTKIFMTSGPVPSVSSWAPNQFNKFVWYIDLGTVGKSDGESWFSINDTVIAQVQNANFLLAGKPAYTIDTVAIGGWYGDSSGAPAPNPARRYIDDVKIWVGY